MPIVICFTKIVLHLASAYAFVLYTSLTTLIELIDHRKYPIGYMPSARRTGFRPAGVLTTPDALELARNAIIKSLVCVVGLVIVPLAPLPHFAVVDDFTRECLALVADTSLAGLRVVRELEAIGSVQSGLYDASLPGRIGKELSRALGQPDTSIGDDQTNAHLAP
jgi:hypothetical protein